jgi:hypothetical protein
MITPLLELTRQAKELTEETDPLELRYFAECVVEGKQDFDFANHRFISSRFIDEIMRDELESEPYMLGCFSSWFLADILGTSTEAIEAIQKAEAFEGLGEMILANGLLENLQRAYVMNDGYGHHFGHYDGEEHEIWRGVELAFYAFRIN